MPQNSGYSGTTYTIKTRVNVQCEKLVVLLRSIEKGNGKGMREKQLSREDCRFWRTCM